MKGLLELPDDVKLKILEVSDPQDLMTCQLVCRVLYSLIVSSPQIQYILALETLGYTMPSVPRLDLTLHQKIEFLERHRRNWSCPDSCQPTEYKLHEAGIWYQFSGGVYACALTRDEDALPWHQSIMGIQFYQLPSPNLALEFREWRIPDFGLSAKGFAIDTAQDLLVLVQLADPSRSWSEGCWIHLRMMSENSQHPKAIVPALLAEFAESEGDLGSRRGPPLTFQIEVMGDLLAVLFRSRTEHTTSCVIVWDWNRGIEVTRISTGTTGKGFLSTFTLLSQTKLLLPRCSKSYYAQEDVPGDTFGSLDIYIFDPHAVISTPPRMIASFDLPRLETKSHQSELRIESNQRSKPPSTCVDTRPKIYDLIVQDRLIAVNVGLRPFDGAQGDSPFEAGLLHVPVRILLHPRTYAQSPEGGQTVTVGSTDIVSKVPWDAWAHLTSWTEHDPSFGGYHQRAAVFPSWYRNHEGEWAGVSREVLLLDFDRRRVRWAKSGKENGETGLCIMPGGAMSVGLGSQSNFGKAEFCGATAEHVRRALPLRSPPEGTTQERMIVDDEHVIVEKLELTPISVKQSLLVYTF